MRTKDYFIKILAYLAIIFGALFFVACLVVTVLSWFYFKDSSIPKKLVLALIIMVTGSVVFFVGVGIFEYLLSFIEVEREVKEVEEEVKKIEEEMK